MKDTLNKIWSNIWNESLENETFWQKFRNKMLSFVRLMIISGTKFYKDACLTRAAALTLAALLTLIPAFSIIVSVFAGFKAFAGEADNIINAVIKYLMPSLNKDIINMVKQQVTSTTSGLTIFSISVLFVSSTALFRSLEEAFSTIWQIKSPRGIIENFKLFWVVLTISPVLVGITVFLTTEYISSDELAITNIVFPMLVSWFLFFFMYQLIPRTRVKLKYSIMIAIIMGTIWELGKTGYGIYISFSIQTYKTIYGTLNIAIIFILWIYISFIIILFGSELVFVLQYPELRKRRHLDSPNLDISASMKNYRFYFIVNIMYIVYKTFNIQGDKTDCDQLLNKLGLETKELDSMVNLLFDHKMIHKFENNKKTYIMPVKPSEKVCIKELFDIANNNVHQIPSRMNTILDELVNNLVEMYHSSLKSKLGAITFDTVLWSKNGIDSENENKN